MNDNEKAAMVLGGAAFLGGIIVLVAHNKKPSTVAPVNVPAAPVTPAATEDVVSAANTAVAAANTALSTAATNASTAQTAEEALQASNLQAAATTALQTAQAVAEVTTAQTQPFEAPTDWTAADLNGNASLAAQYNAANAAWNTGARQTYLHNVLNSWVFSADTIQQNAPPIVDIGSPIVGIVQMRTGTVSKVFNPGWFPVYFHSLVDAEQELITYWAPQGIYCDMLATGAGTIYIAGPTSLAGFLALQPNIVWAATLGTNFLGQPYGGYTWASS